MNTLLLDLSEENPFVSLLFGTDISTARRTGFVSAIHDTGMLYCLVSVSFLFSKPPPSVTGSAAAAFHFTSRAKSFGRASFSTVATLWAGHFMSYAITNNVSKRLRRANEQLKETKGALKARATNALAPIHIATSITTRTATMAIVPENKKNLLDAVEEEQEAAKRMKKGQDRVAAEMDKTPLAFRTSHRRSTLMWLLNPVLLAPFDAISIGVLSSHHLGHAKTTEAVLQVMRRPRMLLPTLSVSLFVRLSLSADLSSLEFRQQSERSESTTTSNWKRILIDRLIVPTVAAVALRSVSGRWGEAAAAAAASKAAATTSSAAAASSADAATGARASSNRFTAMFRAVRSLPSQMRTVVRQTAALPLIAAIAAAYLSFAQIIIAAMSVVAVGIEASHLDDRQNRAKQGKFLIACAENSSLPSYLHDAILLSSSQSLSRSALESVHCALAGGAVSDAARKDAVQSLQQLCAAEIVAVEQALLPFDILYRANINQNNKSNNNKNNNSARPLLLDGVDFIERRATLTALLKHLKETELPNAARFSLLDDAAAPRALLTRDEKILLQYRIRKSAPSLTDKAKLTSDELSLILAVALSDLQEKINKK